MVRRPLRGDARSMNENAQSPKDDGGVRKLTRSSTDKMIGGVAGGLGRYFGVDPILFRIAFVALAFAGGVGILAYIALLAFVPADDGTSPFGAGRNANVIGAILLALVAGMALIITAFIGGARWLVIPALVLVLPLAIVAAADIDVKGGAGERHYRPGTVSEIRPEYRLGMGELEVDLRAVTLPVGTTTTAVKVGVGHAVVRVPDDACVTSDVQVGVGHAQVLDRTSDGVDVAFVQPGSLASAAPRLHLDADIGIGALEVVRGDDPVFSRGYRTTSDILPACPA